MTAEQEAPPVHPLVTHLEDLVREEDRAALAHLRRALGKPPAAATEAHRHVLPWLPPSATRAEEDAAYLIASLFALWHQGKEQPRTVRGQRMSNLGISFRLLPEEVRTGSVEQRFRALINAEREDLPEHLRHAVSLLRAAEIPVDWTQLLRDIRAWDAVDRWVQRQWARAYWGGIALSNAGDDPAADTPIDDLDDLDDDH